MNKNNKSNYCFVMFRKTVATIITIAFVSSCAESPKAQTKSTCGDDKCINVQEEPPLQQTEEKSISVAAEDCLSCLDSTSQTCFEQMMDCDLSINCQTWKDCNNACIVSDASKQCTLDCDYPVREFFTPLKLKSCECEICYFSCFNMCEE